MILTRSYRTTGRGARVRAGPPPVRYDPAAINQPQQPDIKPKDKGNAVVRARSRSRAHFSVGEIDGFFGSNMEKALAAFLAERKTTSAWEALNADTALFQSSASSGLSDPLRNRPG